MYVSFKRLIVVKKTGLQMKPFSSYRRRERNEKTLCDQCKSVTWWIASLYRVNILIYQSKLVHIKRSVQNILVSINNFACGLNCLKIMFTHVFEHLHYELLLWVHWVQERGFYRMYICTGMFMSICGAGEETT